MIEWIFKDYYIFNEVSKFIIFIILILIMILITIFLVVKEIKNEYQRKIKCPSQRDERKWSGYLYRSNSRFSSK